MWSTSTERGRTIGALTLAVAMAVLPTVGCGGGKKRDRASICRQIFTDRTTGIVTPFRTQGPRNEAAFMKLCITLPKPYLACEAQDANRQTAKCARMLRNSEHARRLNAVLTSDSETASTDAGK